MPIRDEEDRRIIHIHLLEKGERINEEVVEKTSKSLK